MHVYSVRVHVLFCSVLEFGPVPTPPTRTDSDSDIIHARYRQTATRHHTTQLAGAPARQPARDRISTQTYVYARARSEGAIPAPISRDVEAYAHPHHSDKHACGVAMPWQEPKRRPHDMPIARPCSASLSRLPAPSSHTIDRKFRIAIAPIASSTAWSTPFLASSSRAASSSGVARCVP